MKHRPAASILYLLLTALVLLAPALAPAQNLSDREIREMDWGGENGGAPSGVERDGGEGLNTGLMLARMLGALALVVALIAVVAWLMRRYLPGSARASGQGGGIRVVATRMLGNRSSLMLVRVRGRTLLLGVTPQSIQTLTEIEELEGEWARPSSAEENADESPASASPFQKQLGKFVNQRVDEERD